MTATDHIVLVLYSFRLLNVDKLSATFRIMNVDKLSDTFFLQIKKRRKGQRARLSLENALKVFFFSILVFLFCSPKTKNRICIEFLAPPLFSSPYKELISNGELCNVSLRNVLTL